MGSTALGSLFLSTPTWRWGRVSEDDFPARVKHAEMGFGMISEGQFGSAYHLSGGFCGDVARLRIYPNIHILLLFI